MDEPYAKYKHICNTAPCLFVKPIDHVLARGLSDSEGELSDWEDHSTASESESGALDTDVYQRRQVRIVTQKRDNIQEALKDTKIGLPCEVSYMNLYNDDLRYAQVSIILNLHDRKVLNDLFRCSYLGLCDPNVT